MRLRKAAAMLAATSAAVVGLGIATAGTASAATSNWGCRADNTGSYVYVGGGVYLDSCIEDQYGGSGNGFYGLIRLQENGGSWTSRSKPEMSGSLRSRMMQSKI